MREEEQLAHDVHAVSATLWSQAEPDAVVNSHDETGP